MKSRARALLLGLAVLVPGAALWLWLRPAAPAAAAAPATYVGRAACADCHAAETAAFAGSQHDLAMQEPTADTVLGDFGGATFTHFDVTSTFARDGDAFTVRTDGPDGKLHDYRIAYVFGVWPLQQYLIDLGGGRLQALGIAWDCRPKSDGGQRWFAIYPDERVPAGDELHWTGIQQNWNFMCAECHSTNLRRGYDAAADRYHTSWSELDVSCEACHGPASRHLAWARGDRRAADKGLVVAFDERRSVAWSNNPRTGLPERSRPRPTQKEIDTCGRCHSRRAVFGEDFVPGRPLLDTHWPALLTEGLYHPDGQMQDEVYNYQSFLQSRMGQQGVTCSDCHDPHRAKLRLPGNGVCLQCHEPRLDSRQHHFHEPGSPAARCVACHAPTTTYMGVDARHDHSFKVPQPELAAFGVPDACTGCHQGREPAWAEAQLQQWYGKQRPPRSPWTAAFAAARAHRPDAPAQLLAIARDASLPGIVRATALHELPAPLDAETTGVLHRALAEPEPLLRWAAAVRLGEAGEVEALRPLLRDAVRGVRIAAAGAMLAVDASGWQPADAAALRAATAEYEAAQHGNADRPEAHLNLGNLALARGDTATAEQEYRAALRLHGAFVPAFANLADLFRDLGRDGDCERILRQGLEKAPHDADLHHALGLCLVRQGKPEPAIEALQQAVAASPAEMQFAYVCAVAQQSVGHVDDAIATLDAACARLPDDATLVALLVDYLVQAGRRAEATARAGEWARRWPDAAVVRQWRQTVLR